MGRLAVVLLIVVLVSVGCGGGGDEAATPAPTPSPTARPTVVPAPTSEATPSPTPTRPSTPSPTPEERATETPTPEPVPAPTETPVPTSTPAPRVTPVPTAAATATPVATVTPTPVATARPTAAPEATPDVAPTATPVAVTPVSVSPVAATPIPTAAPAGTATPAPTPEVTSTGSAVTATPVPTNTPTTESDAFVIGVMASITGPGEHYGGPAVDARKLAVEEINAAGGINGRMLELAIEDSQCDREAVGPAFGRLRNSHDVKIILGTTCGAPMEVLSNVPDLVLLSSSVGAPETVNTHKNFFSTSISDAQLLVATGNVLWDDGNETLATMTWNIDFVRSQLATVVEQYESRGGQVVGGGDFVLRQGDFTEVLQTVLSQDPDGLFVGTAFSADLGGILKQAREMGYEGRIYGEFDGLSLIRVFEIAGEAMVGLRGVIAEFAPGDEKGRGFVAKMQERYGSVPRFPWHAAGAYDNVYMVAECLGQTDDDQDVDGMSECLSGISFTGVLGDDYGFNEEGYVDGLTPVVVEVLPEAERTEENNGYAVVGSAPE